MISPPASHSYLLSTPPARRIADNTSSPSLPSLSELCKQIPSHHSTHADAVLTQRPATLGFVGAKTLLHASTPSRLQEHGLLSNAESKRDSIDRKPLRSLASQGNITTLTQRPSTDFSEPKKKPKKTTKKRSRPEIEFPIDAKTLDQGAHPLPTSKSEKVDRRIKLDSKYSKQAKIAKAKITKPGTERSADGARKPAKGRKNEAKKDPSDGEHPSNDADVTEDGIRAIAGHHEQAGAYPRKRNWTPVRDTDAQESDDDEAFERMHGVGETKRSLSQSNLFGRSLESFGFAEAQLDKCTTYSNDKGLRKMPVLKKKQLELLDASGPQLARVEEGKRNRSPPKKVQTITEKATAPFSGVSSTENTLLEFFRPQSPAKESLGQSMNLKENTTKRKAKPPKLSKKSAIDRSAIILSPASAMKKAQEQEVLFGTSSQLVREESPTYVRALQQAIKESECILEQKDHSTSIAMPGSTTCASSLARPKSLWSAAARDSNESLVTGDPIVAPRARVPSRTGVQAQPDAEGFLDVNSLSDTQVYDLAKGGREVCSSKEEAQDKRLPTEAPTALMPTYSGFTDVQLKKALSSYGFKPIKKRLDMIFLLEKCWKDQQERASVLPAERQVSGGASSMEATGIQSAVPDAGSHSNASSVKKGAPKKDSREASINTQDSTKRARGRPRKAKVACPQGDGQAPKGEEVAVPEKAKEQTQFETKCKSLFDQITNTVKGEIATHDIKNLTWHEKILMYDPIIIEDLTSWLSNKIPLEEGIKGNNLLVKAWCESNSVCCLWKENLQKQGSARH